MPFTVEVEKYVVKDHPLVKGGHVDLMIYMVGGKPVGGNSFPHDEQLDGGYWSLDGKTLEELQPDDYPAWQEKWIRKYSE
ncbi:hypothetical protein [Paenibacillus sp. NFR01]|uniref:hypothetical protein n=1 Tax=Paenibacillus sp. NFR01 TaxID=1566279 RepID=UPI000A4B79AE|nr:hypothetical protein [Paenibacillus sp. NFR01]